MYSSVDNLVEVPNDDGRLPSHSVDYPSSIDELIVSGAESKPSGGKNVWSYAKSKRLLEFYGENAFSGSEDERDEYEHPKARTMRLRVAKRIGITIAQINIANSVRC